MSSLDITYDDAADGKKILSAASRHGVFPGVDPRKTPGGAGWTLKLSVPTAKLPDVLRDLHGIHSIRHMTQG